MERAITIKKKSASGFTLIELLVAMFVFSFVIVAVISTFLSIYRYQKNSREIQVGMENSRVAMESMAKNIRMGAVDGGTEEKIYFYNYSQKKCMAYSFDSGNKKIKMAETAEISRIDNPNCSSVSYGTFFDLVSVSNIESLKFVIQKSNYGTTNPSVGRVTIKVKILGSNEPLQTTISLRDYLE